MQDFFSKERSNSSEIYDRLESLKSSDIPWKGGKSLAYVYEPDPEAYELIQKAYMLYLTENGLDPTAFGSLLKMENDVISTAIQLMQGDENCAGNFTFGGTESIMLAVKSARDYAREKHPHITRPNVVLPITAHAAFHKACHYLCVEVKLVGVDEDTFTPNISDINATIDDQTIMLVCSAPSYAHGVIDPITDIAALADAKDILCHVDACVGGMYLPFARRIGKVIPSFDFSVPGVTSISMDFHKYGYTAKGASCILYRDRDLRKYQIFSCSSWSGYSVVNATVLSSKTGGSLAGCWANLNYLGAEGYEKIVSKTEGASEKVLQFLSTRSDVEVLGNPIMNLIAFTSHDLDLFSLVELMKENGWYIQLQFKVDNSPTNIHLSINQACVAHIDDFIEDLKQCLDNLKSSEKVFDLPFPAEMLASVTPEIIEQMKGALNLSDGEAPKDMTLVNRILDAAPPHVRDMMLTVFANGLYQ